MFPLRDLNPSRSTPWVTWGIILVCILVFLYQVIQPPVVQHEVLFTYALVPSRLTAMLYEGPDAGTVLSVFTSMFMHGGLLHIAGNLWYLRVFGDNVEDSFGHVRFGVFYVLCGVAAALTQWAIDPYSGVPMVGASGAIAGVLAAYMVLYPGARVQTLVPVVIFLHIVELPAIVLIVLWFVLQFFSGVASLGLPTGGGVAYWAHIGGFIAGLVLALLMRHGRRYDDGDGWYRGVHHGSRWRHWEE